MSLSVRALVALILTAATIGVVDVALARGSIEADVLVVLVLATTAAALLVGAPLALGLALVVGLRRRSTASGRERVITGLAGVAALGLAPINAELLGARPVVGLGFVALAGVFAIVAHGLRMREPWRRVTIAAALLVGLGALVVNAVTFVGTNAPQHFTLVLVAWFLLLPAWFVALARVEIEVQAASFGRTLALASLLVAGGVGLVVRASSLASVDPLLAVALRSQAPASHAAFDYLDPILDVDGDGFSAGFGGGDCRPFDPEAFPGGREIAGDGKDQNCFAGDPSADAVAQFETAQAIRGHTPAAARILLITVDALRHDAALPLTAARLGDRCHHYARAYALSPSTTYSIHGLMTSRYPSQGVYTKLGRWNVPVDDPAPRVAGVLGEAGYATAAFAFHHRFDPRLGLSLGFDRVWTAQARPEVIQGPAAPLTHAQAQAWLDSDEAREPWFVWLHDYDPHAPYLRHRPAARSAKDDYDDEVAFTDVHLDAFLEQLPRLDEVAIILTADHGEAFGEHGADRHSSDLFDEQIRVPLWVCPPAGQDPPAPRRRGASAIDVAPTLLDFAGLTPPASFHGRSLLLEHDRPAFAETAGEAAPMQAVIDGDSKLIRVLRGGLWLVFDLADDPGEQRDLSVEEPERLEPLQAWLDTWVAWIAATTPEKKPL